MLGQSKAGLLHRPRLADASYRCCWLGLNFGLNFSLDFSFLVVKNLLLLMDDILDFLLHYLLL